MAISSNYLLRSPVPENDESLAGYILRLCEKNYYDTPRWIFQLAGLSKNNNFVNANLFDPKNTNLYKLYRLTGVSEKWLWSMAYPPVIQKEGNENYIEAFKKHVPRFAIHRQKAPICPVCLQEASYCRKTWDFAIVTSCPSHRCFLVDCCPKCGRLITWTRSSVTKCKCGCDLRESPLEEVRGNGVDLSCQVHLLCGLLDRYMADNSMQMLKGLELGQLNKLMIFMAGQFAHRRGKWRLLTRSSLSSKTLHELLLKAYGIFSNWPYEFYNFLDSYRALNVSHNRDTGIERDFGHFYKVLYKDFSHKNFNFLRKAFEQYLTDRWDGGYINSRQSIGLSINSKRTFLSAAEAGLRLGISVQQVSRLIESGHIEGKIRQMGSRKMILAKEKSVDIYKSMLEEAMSLQQTAQLIGIGHESVVELAQKGYLEAFRGPTADGYSTWLFREEDIARFLNKLDKNALDPENAKHPTVSFSYAVRMCSGASITISDLIRCILDGKLRPYRIGKDKGLSKYGFIMGDLKKYIFKDLEKSQWLTIRDLSQVLKIKQEVAAKLLEKGFIPYSMDPIRKGQRRVSAKAVDEFNEGYIFLREYAKEKGVSPKVLVCRLIEKGIMPVSGPKIDGARQYLFLKQDLI